MFVCIEMAKCNNEQLCWPLPLPQHGMKVAIIYLQESLPNPIFCIYLEMGMPHIDVPLMSGIPKYFLLQTLMMMIPIYWVEFEQSVFLCVFFFCSDIKYVPWSFIHSFLDANAW